MPLDAATPPALSATREFGSFSGFIRLVFSFRTMLAFGLAVVAVCTVSGRFNDPDLWYHLRLGEYIWHFGRPTTDVFSFSAYGHAWTAHEWLSQLGIYGLYRLGGYPALMIGLAFFTSLILILVYSLCYLRTANALVSFLGGVCAWFFASIGTAIRPHMIGYSLLCIELLLLEMGSRDRRWLWGLPPLFALWVNCHGSFFFGMGILGAYCVTCFPIPGWRGLTPDRYLGWKQPVAVLFASVLALCANPVGIHLLLYPLDVAFHQTSSMKNIDEWMPPDFRTERGLGLLVAGALVVLIPLLRRSELRWRDLLLTAMAFGLAMQHVRMLFVFGIVVAPVLARLVDPLLGKPKGRENLWANAVLMIGMAIVIVANFPDARDLEKQVRKDSPVAAVEYIRKNGLHGPIVNAYQFGGYLMWGMQEEKVFIDGRGDVFDWTGVLAEYGRWVTNTEDANLLLDKYQARLCLLSKEALVNRQMANLPKWRKVYSDSVAVLYSRQDSAVR